MFEKKIVLLKVGNVSDQYKVLELLARQLYKEKVVKSSYVDAVIEREKIYPTGLLMENDIGIAIPHTESEHVLQNQIALMTLESPIDFMHMADGDKIVPVRIIFMLALKEPESQLSILQNLMALGQEKDKLASILMADDKSVVLEILNESL